MSDSKLILKNPLIIALILGILTYIILYFWTRNKNNNVVNGEKKDYTFFNLLISILVFVLVWILIVWYDSRPIQVHQIGMGDKNNSVELFDKDVHLVGKNSLKIPVDDIFIDLAKF